MTPRTKSTRITDLLSHKGLVAWTRSVLDLVRKHRHESLPYLEPLSGAVLYEAKAHQGLTQSLLRLIAARYTTTQAQRAGFFRVAEGSALAWAQEHHESRPWADNPIVQMWAKLSDPQIRRYITPAIPAWVTQGLLRSDHVWISEKALEKTWLHAMSVPTVAAALQLIQRTGGGISGFRDDDVTPAEWFVRYASLPVLRSQTPGWYDQYATESEGRILRKRFESLAEHGAFGDKARPPQAKRKPLKEDLLKLYDLQKKSGLPLHLLGGEVLEDLTHALDVGVILSLYHDLIPYSYEAQMRLAQEWPVDQLEAFFQKLIDGPGGPNVVAMSRALQRLPLSRALHMALTTQAGIYLDVQNTMQARMRKELSTGALHQEVIA